MQKIRQPDSFAGAVTVIAVSLGFDGAGAVIGKTDGLIRKFADPDCDSKPSIEQAVALDVAYHKQTGEQGPLFQVYAEKLREAGAPVHQPKSLRDRLIDVHSEVADVHNAITKGTRDARLTAAERASCIKEIDEAIAELRALKRDVDAMAKVR